MARSYILIGTLILPEIGWIVSLGATSTFSMYLNSIFFFVAHLISILALLIPAKQSCYVTWSLVSSTHYSFGLWRIIICLVNDDTRLYLSGRLSFAKRSDDLNLKYNSTKYCLTWLSFFSNIKDKKVTFFVILLDRAWKCGWELQCSVYVRCCFLWQVS